jgi:hypothetical protein
VIGDHALFPLDHGQSYLSGLGLGAVRAVVAHLFAQQSLYAIGDAISYRFSQLPAILPFRLSQEPTQVFMGLLKLLAVFKYFSKARKKLQIPLATPPILLSS